MQTEWQQPWRWMTLLPTCFTQCFKTSRSYIDGSLWMDVTSSRTRSRLYLKVTKRSGDGWSRSGNLFSRCAWFLWKTCFVLHIWIIAEILEYMSILQAFLATAAADFSVAPIICDICYWSSVLLSFCQFFLLLQLLQTKIWFLWITIIHVWYAWERNIIENGVRKKRLWYINDSLGETLYKMEKTCIKIHEFGSFVEKLSLNEHRRIIPNLSLRQTHKFNEYCSELTAKLLHSLALRNSRTLKKCSRSYLSVSANQCLKR